MKRGHGKRSIRCLSPSLERQTRARGKAPDRPLAGPRLGELSSVPENSHGACQGSYLALSGNVPHIPPMINQVSPCFIHVCVIFDSLPLPSTVPSGYVSTRVNR